MFQYQIDDFRRTIGRIVQRPVPPEILRIKLAHAEYLGIKHWFSKPVNEVRRSGMISPNGVPYGAIVCVYTLELYNALKSAEGVDVKDRKAGQAQATDHQAGGPQDPGQDQDSQSPQC